MLKLHTDLSIFVHEIYFMNMKFHFEMQILIDFNFQPKTCTNRENMLIIKK